MSEYPTRDHARVANDTVDAPKTATIDMPEVYAKITENPEVRDTVFSMLESLDKTKFMEITRKVWDKVPATFQNVMLRMPSLLPQIGLLKGFARCGLLTPKDPDLSIEDISKTDEVMQKVALWLAKKLVPAMAEFDTTVNPALQKLGFEKGFDGFVELQKSLSTEFYENMRTRLKITRLQREVRNKTELLNPPPAFFSGKTAANDNATGTEKTTSPEVLGEAA